MQKKLNHQGDALLVKAKKFGFRMKRGRVRQVQVVSKRSKGVVKAQLVVNQVLGAAGGTGVVGMGGEKSGDVTGGAAPLVRKVFGQT